MCGIKNIIQKSCGELTYHGLSASCSNLLRNHLSLDGEMFHDLQKEEEGSYGEVLQTRYDVYEQSV